jgi:hypothetical protein
MFLALQGGPNQPLIRPLTAHNRLKEGYEHVTLEESVLRQLCVTGAEVAHPG